jgi:hypothetical protein
MTLIVATIKRWLRFRRHSDWLKLSWLAAKREVQFPKETKAKKPASRR